MLKAGLSGYYRRNSGETTMSRLAAYLIVSISVVSASILACSNTYTMKAGSMEPTIMQNEIVRITGSSEYRPQRGDIVAYRVDSSIAPEDKVFVHRCVAVEGDEFLVREGNVYLNGNKLTEPYIHGKKTEYYGTPSRCEGKVPAGMIVVLGDNRDNARDSRVIGHVALKNIVGKVEKMQ